MVVGMRWALSVAVTIGVLAAAGPAGAKTFSAEQGAVKATVTYSKTATSRLTISRNGTTLFDGAPSLEACGGAPCAPSGFEGDPPLRVLDLDADGEPEVVYSAYSGGAHCCSIAQVYRLDAGATTYSAIARNFGDPGFIVAEGNAGHPAIWITRDDAFAYRFTAYAFSGLPVQILQYSAAGFADVTSSYPKLVAADASHWRSVYRRARHRTDGTQRGAAAAWAADEYRLGKRADALRYLRAEVKRGHLKRRFLKSLDRFLKKHGY
jgi:hypothetical protein